MTSEKQRSRLRHRRLARLAIFLSLSTNVAAGQFASPAPASPRAMEAVKKGIVASKQQDYLLAIRYFQEARVQAPQSPEIFVNLGLAEANIPGRELRAICWFEAYLAANPGARNAAAVKEEIDALEVKNQSNLSRLIKLMEDEVGKMPAAHRSADLSDVAILWAKAGDLAAAGRIADGIGDTAYKSRAWQVIAYAQVATGNIAEAQKIADRIEDPLYKSRALQAVASAQAAAGDWPCAKQPFLAAQEPIDLIVDLPARDRAEAELSATESDAGYSSMGFKTANLIQDPSLKHDALARVDRLFHADDYSEKSCSEAAKLVAAGNTPVADVYFRIARSSAEKIPDDGEKCYRMLQIAIEWSKTTELADAWETLVAGQEAPNLIVQPARKHNARKNLAIAEAQIRAHAAANRDPKSATPPVLIHPAVSVWLARLDDDNSDPMKWKSILGGDCPLNTLLFLDLRGYLRTLPAGTPQALFDTHSTMAWCMVRAQNVVDQMLKG